MAYEILDRIRTPEDLRALGERELNTLCGEIRAFLLEHVSKTGGHLASNLGIVETSVALCRVLDTARDRIIYDVGHQSYVHKILTDRREAFSGLRSFGGISGFMRPGESIHDPFVTGHASNAVSAALGLARAARLQGKSIRTVAVLGDGALTGGLAYEALNDAGASGERILVILNNNGMSIDRNVGALSRYLSGLRISPRYLRAKRRYHTVMEHIPGGRALGNVLSKAKERFKALFLQLSFFEQMGFTCLGPMDGNDCAGMCRAIRDADRINGPVLLHIVTKKGLGYAPSEENPENYHGVSRFEPALGREGGDSTGFSARFGQELCRLAAEDARICAVTAAMPAGCGLLSFREAFPDRYFDVGIAEEHAVTMASGLAAGGMKPVFAVYSTFLQRGFDELIHDTAIMKNPVVFAVDRAGLVGADGETHHGVFDIGYLSLVPGMKIWMPASFAELSRMLSAALAENRPAALRYPRGGEGEWTGDAGLEPLVCTAKGEHFTLVSHGRMWNTALAVAGLLSARGLSCSLWKLNCLPAPDLSPLIFDAETTGRLVFLEETAENAGAYAALAPRLRGSFSCRHFSLGRDFVTHGSEQALFESLGLTPDRIAAALAEDI